MMSKKSSSNRKRFSDDQIRSLETTFETESRPELRLKQHLASKLGLQPRQVAIWFQNKRARSKSKQIEGQYSVLKSNYDKLASQFDALRKENQGLHIQLQRLRKIANGKREEDNDENKCAITTANCEKQRYLVGMDGQDHDQLSMVPSDLSRSHDYLEEEADIFDMVRIAASPDNGCSFQSATFLDHSSQLWDF